MAYVYDNKTYRNLQQQVKENMDNIAELQDSKLVGIDVAGIVPDYSSLPSSAEQGQVYAVGSASPYELYVYNNSSWVDFGEFPKAGPQGEQGPQGEPGRQGPRGLTGPQGPKGYTGAPGIPGPVGQKGDQGPKGDKGDTGLVDSFAKDSASITAIGQAYVDANGYLQVCTSLSPLTFEQGGYIKGPQGDQGIQGPQGPKGNPGDPASIKVNGNTYTRDTSGLITLPDYPDEVAWGKIHGTLNDQTDLKNALEAKQDVISDLATIRSGAAEGATAVQPAALSEYAKTSELAAVATSGNYNDLVDKLSVNNSLDITKDSSNVIKTIYGGAHWVYWNNGNPGSINGNKIDLNLPLLTWGTYGAYTKYAYEDDKYTAENCYRCWLSFIKNSNLKVDDVIKLTLTYTSSTGEYVRSPGTGSIHSDTFIKPNHSNHQIRLVNVNFTSLNISGAEFIIKPGSKQIYITCSQLLDSSSQPITNIRIYMDITVDDVYTAIDSKFIGTDIARTADIKTKTSQLTNDSGFVTSTELATKQDKLVAGTNITIEGNVISATGGSVNWSDILDKPTFATVATSGSYNDLSDKPTIPTTTGELTNDSGFITSAALTGYATTSDVSTAVSTAISSQTKETWTFTLSDGSTTTKTIVLGE